VTTPRRSAMHMLIAKGAHAFGGAFEIGRALLADAPEPSAPAPAESPRIASPPQPHPRGTGDAAPRTAPPPPPVRGCSSVGGNFRCLLIDGHKGSCVIEEIAPP
jgi:hypothetical protein